jgi:hypothetical protein
MRRPLVVRAVLAGCVVALGAGCGGDEEGASPAQTETAQSTTMRSGPVEVALSPEHDSKLSGTATLTPDASGFEALLEVDGALDGMHAHVHDVTCAEYRDMTDFNAQLATVSDSLADFKDGVSVTDVTVLEDGGLAARTTGDFSINMHKVAYPYETVACGDIPKS